MVKDSMLSHKIGNKARMYAFNTGIPHVTGSQDNKARKGNKRHTAQKRKKYDFFYL